jgi:hypothetical protein
MAFPKMKTDYTSGNSLTAGTTNSTLGVNAMNYETNALHAYVEMSAIHQIQSAFNTYRIETAGSVALSASSLRGIAIEDITDSTGYFNLINSGSTTMAFDTNHYQIEASPTTDNTSTELSEAGFETVATWTFGSTFVDGVTGTSAQSSAWGDKTGSQAWRGTFGGSSAGAGNTSVVHASKAITWANVAGMKLDFSHTNSGTASNSTLRFSNSATYNTGTLISSTTSSDSNTDYFVNTEDLTGSTIYVKGSRNPNSGAATITFDVDDLKTFRYVTTNKILQSTALTSSSDWDDNITHVLVYLEWTAALKGTDTITVDISTDNGSTYTTGSTFTQIATKTPGTSASLAGHTGFIPITSTQGKQVMLKFNVSNSTGGSTSKLYRFGMAALAVDV